MKKIFLSASITALFVLCISSAAFADVRIKQRQNLGGRSMESEVLIKGARQRSEMELAPGMKTVNIMQCDLKRTITLNDAARKYMIASMNGDSTASGSTIDVSTNAAPDRRKGGIVTTTITTTDTGERKQMFGFTARHIRMTMVTESSPDACEQQKQKFETDGWYIDFSFNIDCVTDNPMPQGRMQRPTGCQDQHRYKRIGTAKAGYPVNVTTRMFDADGNESFTMNTEVVELSQATLDAALFDIPSGYTEARSQQEMYTPASIAGAMGNSGPGGMTGSENNSAAGTASAPTSKKPGSLRIGVVGLENRTSESFDGESLRRRLIGSLMGANLDAVAIYSKAPSEVTAEAKQKDCDFVLYTDVTNLKQASSNKIGGFLGRAAGVGDVVKTRFDSQVDFRLLATGSESPQLQSKSSAKEDGDANASIGAAIDKEAKMVSGAARKK
jgi:hypothetical protein